MTRVLYISYDGLAEPLGQSQVMPYLCALSRRGYAVTVLSFEKPPGSRASLMEERQVRRQLERSGVRWIRLRYHKAPSALATGYDVLHGILRGLLHVGRDRTRIVHARSYVAGVIGWWLCRISGARFVFDIRGFWADERVEGGIWNADSRLYRAAKWVERRLFLRADAVVSLTEAGKRLIEALPYLQGRCPPVTVIPTCVDVERFVPQAPPDHLLRELQLNGHLRVLYAGSLGTWYALDELLGFFRSVRNLRREARLLLLTDTPRSAIDPAIRAAGLGSEEVIVRAVPPDQMPEWLSLADVGACFIKPVPSKRASHPTKVGEWLSCGMPVVISRGIGDADRLIEEGRVGVTVPFGDPAGYAAGARAVIDLLQDPLLRTRCRAVATEQLGLDMGVDRYASVYERLTAETP